MHWRLAPKSKQTFVGNKFKPNKCVNPSHLSLVSLKLSNHESTVVYEWLSIHI